MKRYEFIGKLTYDRRLNCSVSGNPAWYAEFTSEDGERLCGRTASDAACAYGFENKIHLPRKVKYHITRNGNVIIDYADVLTE